MSNGVQDNNELEDESQPTMELHGLLVTYSDDQLNESVNSALKRKYRVRYRCMDTFANFLAFGTSGGNIYLYKLKSMTHSSCSMISIIACDQGSIEVIKFLPNTQTDDLLIAIGTTRGSLVVFRLSQLPSDQNPVHNEIYRAELFTNGPAVKMIECDLDLLDPTFSFSKLYICDTDNRLYVLDSENIYRAKQSLRLRFYSNNHLPSLIFSVTDSNINQISVHRSQLLISTDETTRLFNEATNQLYMIGKKKRKEGFYGACFFNPNHKPMQVLQLDSMGRPSSSQHLSAYSSTNSLADLENLMIFVARPMFRLWQVNYKRVVMFTHQFESLVKSKEYAKVVELQNAPLEDGAFDDATSVLRDLAPHGGETNEVNNKKFKSDHFNRLVPIYSSTLGNLLLSHSQHELFVIDPIGAKLIVCYSQESPIVQVCCNENELFVWSLTNKVANINETDDREPVRQYHVRRLVLLAPTQFLLELHRIHRFLTLVSVVQMFADVFRKIMALPLSGSGVITTEGGLLRNVLLNAWDTYESQVKRINDESQSDEEQEDDEDDRLRNSEQFAVFKQIIEEILEEGRQMRNSFESLTDSRFFLTMTSENIERLCSEPYTSLVSLEISLANLHTSKVINFSKEALDRHKSVANLTQSIRDLHKMRQITQSEYDLTDSPSKKISALKSIQPTIGPQTKVKDNRVIVERQRPRRSTKPKRLLNDISSTSRDVLRESDEPIETRERSFSENATVSSDGRDSVVAEAQLTPRNGSVGEMTSLEPLLEDPPSQQQNIVSVDSQRCPSCLWPKSRSHLDQMVSSQRIQKQWIEDNFLDDFETNVDQIEKHAFKHGIWLLWLKCLAFKKKLDDYITCCMALDDVRLLDNEQFTSSYASKEELIDNLLVHMNRKMDNQLEWLAFNESSALEQGESQLERRKRQEDIRAKMKQYQLTHCLKCSKEYPSTKEDDLSFSIAMTLGNSREPSHEDAFSFELVNLLEQFLLDPHLNTRSLIDSLLKFPNLLNNSKIPAIFYLKVIGVQVAIANQSPLSKARLDKLQAANFRTEPSSSTK